MIEEAGLCYYTLILETMPQSNSTSAVLCFQHFSKHMITPSTLQFVLLPTLCRARQVQEQRLMYFCSHSGSMAAAWTSSHYPRNMFWPSPEVNPSALSFPCSLIIVMGLPIPRVNSSHHTKRLFFNFCGRLHFEKS